jgi:type VI secretion system secreted protein Hcp
MVPTDIQSGQPSGPRLHKPLVITKIFDQSSPLLYMALTTGERLQCEIEWFRTDMEGKQELYFTHELEDAVITNIQAYMPNCQDPTLKHFTHLERVSFTYRKIKWTHDVGSTEGEDDWRAPILA